MLHLDAGVSRLGPARRYSPVMMSIGKLRAGQEGYYLAAVAHTIDEYYTEAGEVPGRWLGTCAAQLQLVGEVHEDDFRAVLSGVDPSTGEALRRRNASLHAFDLTLSAPKSVSLLWALGDTDTAAAVVEAHEHAVDQTIGYLEREGVRSRRGHNGIEAVEGGGVIGAAFRHRTSRAGDPQLHTHVVVANATCCEDGVWRSLDGRHLYAQARTAGYLYQAELRLALTRSLGVGWEYPIKGSAELVGIPRDVLREFSRRRIKIEEAAAALGDSSVPARRRLADQTRTTKDHDVDFAQLAAEWRQRADLYGLNRDRVQSLVRSQQTSVPESTAVDDEHLGRMLNWNDTTFDRRAVLQLLAHHSQHGATMPDLEVRADEFLASSRVEPVGVALTGVQYATVELLETEQRLLDTVAERRHGGYAVCAGVEPTAYASVSKEQHQMVVALTTNGAGVTTVVGAAGSGKTHALRAAREVWERDCYQVLGCALAARTAAHLQAATGIPSCSIERLLAALGRPGVVGLPRDSVLVIDEAAMVGTRKLSCLRFLRGRVAYQDRARRRPSPTPCHRGRRHLRCPRTTTPARFTSARTDDKPTRSNAGALAEFRDGETARALGILAGHGRVHDHATKAEARAQMVDHWLDQVLDGSNALMLALHPRRRHRPQPTSTRRAPSRRRPRPRQRACGRSCVRRRRLGHDATPTTIGSASSTANAARSRPSILGATRSPSPSTTTSRWRSRAAISTTAASITPTPITVHKAQGQTCDIALVLGGEELYREAGYSALTRGRHENHLYTAAPEPDLEAHVDDESLDGFSVVLQALERSRGHDLAITAIEPRARQREASRTVDDGLDVGLDL